MASFGTLTVLPSFAAFVPDAEHVVLTRKFIAGMERYRRLWPGRVKVVLHPAERVSDDLDHVTVNPRELSFGLEVVRYDSAELKEHLAGSALVLAGPDHRIPRIVELCASLDIPCVNITEYSLYTRLQIAWMHARNPLRFLRTAAWEVNQERLALRTISRSAGVQCNGTPTFGWYRRFSKNPLLYLDTRTEQSMFATSADMEDRARRLQSGRPLTLVFSGRLIPMKGADDLIEVAVQLKRRGFPFRFLIAGDGSSFPGMQRRIEHEGLHEVHLMGSLPFAEELVPMLRREADLFVVCHRQGDPSCTYLETLAAGVPLIGYQNEAFAGLLELADVGFGVPLNQPEKLAQRITELTREQIWQRAQTGLRFAQQHAFEKTFKRRVEHLIEIADRWQLRGRPSLASPVGA
jgi:glycosyltransferase involved in cell wall biosynthesis